MRARRFFSDARGRVVLFQVPNAPLILWFAAAGADRILDGVAGEVARLVAFGAMFTWSWLEITQGTTPFRRVLGAAVLAWGLATRVT